MGPLEGYRIVEMAGIGAGPHCAMLFADMGAEVVRVDRTQPSGLGIEVETRYDLVNRGRRSVAVDLKTPEGVETVLRLVERADALIESFRPGVMERLGLGPEVCRERNRGLVYGRMTGWGQDGPLARAAGHDIDYIALSGALHAIGPRDGRPLPPLNLIGDFGGGAVHLAFGMVCALLEARGSGEGQVVDGSMLDGATYLMTMIYGMHAAGTWTDRRGDNILDGGAHFYDTYETRDGKYIAVGAIEPKFYRRLLELTGLADDASMHPHTRREDWPRQRETLAAVMQKKTRDEWCAILEGSDACFAPVMSLAEARDHPHAKARALFVDIDGVAQPAPAPRFSRTPAAVQGPPAKPGQHTDAVLADWGFGSDEIAALRKAGAVA